jgi:hypothetical protein
MEAEITHDIAHKLWVQDAGNVNICQELNPAVTLHVSRHLGFSGDGGGSATIDDTTSDLLKRCGAVHTHGIELLDHLLKHQAKMQVHKGRMCEMKGG